MLPQLLYKLSCFRVLYLQLYLSYLSSNLELGVCTFLQIPSHLYFLSIFTATAKMSPPQSWYCGNCKFGPMSVSIDDYCVDCHRQRDAYATYEDLGTPHTYSHVAEVLPPSTSFEVPSPGTLRSATSKSERLSSASMTYRHDLCHGDGSCHEWDHAAGQSTPMLVSTQQFGYGPGALTKWFCCGCTETLKMLFCKANGQARSRWAQEHQD